MEVLLTALAIPFVGWSATSIVRLMRGEAATKEAIKRIDANIADLKEGQDSLIHLLLNKKG